MKWRLLSSGIHSGVSPVGDRISNFLFDFFFFFFAAGPQEFSYFCLSSLIGVLALQTYSIVSDLIWFGGI